MEEIYEKMYETLSTVGELLYKVGKYESEQEDKVESTEYDEDEHSKLVELRYVRETLEDIEVKLNDVLFDH